MSDSADLLARLIEAGTPAHLVAEVARLQARSEVDREAIEGRRQRDRDRQNARRNNVTSRDIADVTDTPPALDKEIPPTPPKEIKPTPRVCNALARKAGGFGPPQGVELASWNAFASQRRKPITRIAYDRICATLDESREVGWPPGEMIDTATERGWETIFVPTEPPKIRSQANARARPANDGFGPSTRAAFGFLDDG